MISTSDETKARVASIGVFGESYEDIIIKLLKFYEDNHTKCPNCERHLRGDKK